MNIQVAVYTLMQAAAITEPCKAVLIEFVRYKFLKYLEFEVNLEQIYRSTLPLNGASDIHVTVVIMLRL